MSVEVSTVDAISNWIKGNLKRDKFAAAYIAFMKGDIRELGAIYAAERQAPLRSFTKFLGRHISRSVSRRSAIPTPVVDQLYRAYCKHFLRPDVWRCTSGLRLSFQGPNGEVLFDDKTLGVDLTRTAFLQNGDGLDIHFIVDGVHLKASLVHRTDRADVSFARKCEPIFREIFEKSHVCVDMNDIRFATSRDTVRQYQKPFLDLERETQKYGLATGPDSYVKRMRRDCIDTYSETPDSDDRYRGIVGNLLTMVPLIQSARAALGLPAANAIKGIWRETAIRASAQVHVERMYFPHDRATALAQINYENELSYFSDGEPNLAQWGNALSFLNDVGRGVAVTRLLQAADKYPALVSDSAQFRLDKGAAKLIAAGQSVEKTLRNTRIEKWTHSENKETCDILARGYMRVLSVSHRFMRDALTLSFIHEIGRLDGIYAPKKPAELQALLLFHMWGFDLTIVVKQFKKIPRWTNKLRDALQDATDVADAFQTLIQHACNVEADEMTRSLGWLTNSGRADTRRMCNLLLGKTEILPLQVLRLSKAWHRQANAIADIRRLHDLAHDQENLFSWPTYIPNRIFTAAGMSLDLTWLKNPHDLFLQGVRANNCVAGYTPHMCRPFGLASHIAKIDTHDGHPFATVEFEEVIDGLDFKVGIRQIQYVVKPTPKVRSALSKQMKAIAEELRNGILLDETSISIRTALEESCTQYLRRQQSDRTVASITAEIGVWKRFSKGLQDIVHPKDLVRLASATPIGRQVVSEISSQLFAAGVVIDPKPEESAPTPSSVLAPA